jgi:hypothetical protein
LQELALKNLIISHFREEEAFKGAFRGVLGVFGGALEVFGGALGVFREA